MNPITAFLVAVCIAAGVTAAYWVNSYFALGFLVGAVLIALRTEIRFR